MAKDNWLQRCNPEQAKKDRLQHMNNRRLEMAIRKRIRKGEKPSTSPKLAEMMKRLYGDY